MIERNPSAPRILCVDDDISVGRLLRAIVEKEGYTIEITTTGKEFLRALTRDAVDLCLLDLHLPDASGFDLLHKIGQLRPGLPALMLTGSESIQDAVEAMRRGALDYLTKPFDSQRLAVSLRNALSLSRQNREIQRLRSDVREAYALEHMVGSSSVMKALRELIGRVAPSGATVLVCGESGTGKELVARALHSASPRRDRPFVDVNTAALTETLLESELFGHEKGAFTGAVSQRRGKFEQADGGTLFLDEIGDMPAPTQAKILRVLQEKSLQRVGGDEKVDIDVRVLCATNRNLEHDVQQERFRRDLYYRINTVTIDAPPLRSRASDIPELARHFLIRACHADKRPEPALSPAALEALARHPWPGNVRELQHAIERALLVSGGEVILPEHLPAPVLSTCQTALPSPRGQGLIEVVENLERSMITAALDRNGWVKSRAARDLKITERILSYKIQNLGIVKTL